MQLSINDTVIITANGTRRYKVYSEDGNKIQLVPEYSRRKTVTLEVEREEVKNEVEEKPKKKKGL